MNPEGNVMQLTARFPVGLLSRVVVTVAEEEDEEEEEGEGEDEDCCSDRLSVGEDERRIRRFRNRRRLLVEPLPLPEVLAAPESQEGSRREGSIAVGKLCLTNDGKGKEKGRKKRKKDKRKGKRKKEKGKRKGKGKRKRERKKEKGKRKREEGRKRAAEQKSRASRRGVVLELDTKAGGCRKLPGESV